MRQEKPLLFYLSRVLMGKPAAEVALVWNITTTSVNAIISAVVAVIILP